MDVLEAASTVFIRWIRDRSESLPDYGPASEQYHTDREHAGLIVAVWEMMRTASGPDSLPGVYPGRPRDQSDIFPSIDPSEYF